MAVVVAVVDAKLVAGAKLMLVVEEDNDAGNDVYDDADNAGLVEADVKLVLVLVELDARVGKEDADPEEAGVELVIMDVELVRVGTTDV